MVKTNYFIIKIILFFFFCVNLLELQDWKIRIDANKDIITNLEETLKDLHEKNLEMK